MRSFTTKSTQIMLLDRASKYTLARQIATKYFPQSPLDGTYAVLDLVNFEIETGQQLVRNGHKVLTLSNGI